MQDADFGGIVGSYVKYYVGMDSTPQVGVIVAADTHREHGIMVYVKGKDGYVQRRELIDMSFNVPTEETYLR